MSKDSEERLTQKIYSHLPNFFPKGKRELRGLRVNQ